MSVSSSLRVADSFDGWQVLRFDAADVRVESFARQRMLHLQLFHEGSGVSFVTPSRMTDGAIEISARDGAVLRVFCYGELATVLQREFGIRAPSLHRLAAAVRWFLVPEIRKQLTKGQLP